MDRDRTINGWDSNPFATRWTQPDRVGFIFEADDSLAACLDQCQHQNWRGQIVGPHGAGKSTLLATLVPAIEQRGFRAAWYCLRDRQRRLPSHSLRDSVWNEQTLVVVDGYEQLSAFSAWQLQRQVRRTGAGLIVTTHQTCRKLDVLRHVQPHLERFQAVVTSLLSRHGYEGAFTSAMIARAYWQHRGNQREALFQLYDEFDRLPASFRMQLRLRSDAERNHIRNN